MKKTYETPVCQTICTADEDILTTSYTEFMVAVDGDFDDGAKIQWS